MDKVELKVDWCSYEAAKYACENWHYSGCMPAGKIVKVGAWEDSKFIGCVLFSRGATPEIGKPYGLQQTEICELTRIALNKHKSFVSQIMSKAIALLCKSSIGIRLIVSFADSEQGHTGGIYQATNFVFTGIYKAENKFFIIDGKKIHGRTLGSKYGKGGQSLQWLKRNVSQNIEYAPSFEKYRYLYPLDKAMKKQIEPLRKPYPKREKPA